MLKKSKCRIAFSVAKSIPIHALHITVVQRWVEIIPAFIVGVVEHPHRRLDGRKKIVEQLFMI